MTPKTSAGTITSTEVRELLRTAAEKLSAREEKALRMRAGAKVDRSAPLPRRGQDHPDSRAELMAMEIELKRKLEDRAAPSEPAAKAVRTKEKDKIIRALRRLK